MPSPRISLAQLHRATGAARPAPPAQAPFSGQWRFDLQQVDGSSHPKTIELNLISPTQPEKDRKVPLTQSESEPRRYIGQLDDKVEGRRFVELLDGDAVG